MLTLPARSVGRALVFSDDGDPKLVWACAARPRLHAAGGLLLLRYQYPDGAAPGAAGARIAIDADLALTPEEIAALESETGSAVRPVSFNAARLAVSVAGERVADVDATAADTRVVVAADVPAKAADLLAGVLVAGALTPVALEWTASLRARAGEGGVRVTADEERLRTWVEQLGPGGRLRLLPREVIETVVRIDLHGADQAFGEWALAELDRRIADGEPLSFSLASHAVVDLPVRLVTTVDELVPGRVGLVLCVDLDTDPLLRERVVTLQALAPFGPGGLSSVDVELTPDGEPARVVALVDGAAKTWKAPPGRGVRWRWRGMAHGGGSSPWSEGRFLESDSVVVAVPRADDVSVEVHGGALDLVRRWRRVDVDLSWSPEGAPPEQHRLVIDVGAPVARWSRAPRWFERGRLVARCRYLAYGGAVVTTETEFAGGQILLEDPAPLQLREVVALPSGSGWPELAGAMLDLRHEDDGVVTRETLVLHSDTAPVWRWPARSSGSWQYRWRLHLSWQDGRYEVTPWTDDERGVLPVHVPLPDRVEIRVVPVFFDAARESRVRLVFTPDQGAPVSMEVRDAASFVVTVRGRAPVTWVGTWERPDGATRTTDPAEVRGGVLVLPRS